MMCIKEVKKRGLPRDDFNLKQGTKIGWGVRTW